MGASNRSFQIVNIDTARVVYAGFSGVMQRPRQSGDPIYSFRVFGSGEEIPGSGILNAFRAKMNSDVRDAERLAVTIDMTMGYNAYTRSHLGVKYGLAQLAVHTVQVLGYTTLSRVSEYLQVCLTFAHLVRCVFPSTPFLYRLVYYQVLQNCVSKCVC